MYNKRIYWLTRSNMTFKQYMVDRLHSFNPACSIAQASELVSTMPQLPRYSDHTLAHSTELGLYPLFYICADSSCLCPVCANEQERKDRENDFNADYWRDKSETIIACDVNWESCDLYCDACSKQIESAYADCDNCEQEAGADQQASS